MISVVLRARNEAAWIGRCLSALRAQALPDLDIVLVDNASSDDTVAIAQRFGARVTHISDADFTFGRALNRGIAETRHEVVALLSAHCIPLNELWADYLLAHLDHDAPAHVAGVYGRQEPLPDSDDVDRRDLWTTFRAQRVVQQTDYFFHNANSAVRKRIWSEIPFDETINGVEDSDWGRKMIASGRAIVYEPAAAVYHHHGIHHGRNAARAARVAAAVAEIRQNHRRDIIAATRPHRIDPDIVREELIALGLPIAAMKEQAPAPAPLPAPPQAPRIDRGVWSLDTREDAQKPRTAVKTA